MPDDHAAAIERAFTHQARAFEDRRFNRILTTDVEWVLEDVRIEVRGTVRPLAPWLDQTDTDGDARARIIAALRADLDGGPRTGFAPRERDG